MIKDDIDQVTINAAQGTLNEYTARYDALLDLSDDDDDAGGAGASAGGVGMIANGTKPPLLLSIPSNSNTPQSDSSAFEVNSF